MSFNVAIVMILLGGWAFGRLFARLHLPTVLGMLVCGVLISTFALETWPAGLVEIEPFLKTFALIVILLRAGLGIHRSTLNRVGGVALRLAIIPCALEGVVLMFTIHYLFGFSWTVSGLSAFMLAAVSPAVVVPAMLNLNEQGYGRKNEVPTAILAGASVDDVLAITLFSLFLRMAVSGDASWATVLWSGPLAITLGLLPGIAGGYLLAAWFRKRHRDVRATEKALILLMIAVLLVQAGDWLHGAALLGIMAMGFILLERVEHVAHELAMKLAKIWVFAEIILFVLIGMAVDIDVAWRAGPTALTVIVIGMCARSIGVWLATWRSVFTRSERVFCVLAYLPKATVQAALGSVPLAMGLPGGEQILALAVLAIAVTAPIGLIGIRLGGPRLLQMEFEDESKPDL